MADSTGIYKHGAGWRAVVSKGRGVPPSQRHFSADTSFAEMQAWRKDEHARLRLTRKQRATAGTFEHDARRYLRAVSAMPSFVGRKADIELWIGVFGRQRRDTITSADIREQRDIWVKAPRTAGAPPYAASTINHRLRALSNLWTVLDGRRAANPVRDVPEVPEPEPLPRAIDYATIEAILGALRELGTKETGKRASLTKLRLRVLAYTGLTEEELRRMTKEDVNLDAATMRVGRRNKGAGAPGAILPLLPEAVEAFRALDAANAWGPFSGSSLWKSFTRAAKRVGVTGVRPHDLRHSVGALIYRATGKLQTVKTYLRHRQIETTHRYALAAVSDVLTADLAVVRQFGTTGPKD